jgi:hypothetical protein
MISISLIMPPQDNLIDELTKIEPKVQDVVKDYLKE